jgi:hypothetical protein
MPSRRFYPAWLPPNPSEREVLVRIHRRQTAVILWLTGLLPVGWIILSITGSEFIVAALTLFWIAFGIALAQRFASIRCPRCKEPFCAPIQPPYWNGLFVRRCDNCGLSLYPARDSED